MDQFKKCLHILVSALLVSCSSTTPPDTRTYSAIDAELLKAIESNRVTDSVPAPPDQVTNALLPAMQLNIPNSSGINVEPRFDIKVNRANARQFFMGLVEGTPYNMVVHPNVKGKITLALKNVTVDEVMEVVRNVYGMYYERNKTAYHVYPNTIRTRIFNIDYLAIKRTGTSKMRVSSGQVTQAALSGSDGSSSSSRETLAASSIDTTSDSDFWGELRGTLVSIIGNKAGRSVVLSPQSGVIVIRAMPAELRAIEKYLNKTQSIMQRQVLLEAKVIEIELSDGFQSGVNWAALKNTGSSQALIGQTGGGTLFDNGTSIIAGNTGDLNPGALSQITGTAASAFGGIFTAALNIKSNFSAFIELLKTQGDVQVLSSPQISTLNNQKAVIKVGTDEFFVTDVETNTNTSSTTSSTQNNVELTPFFSGVALDVIPQISENNDIILHIHPTVVEVTEKVKNISVSSSTTLSVPLAVSSIRESDTIIRAKNRQVVIIGGLMQTKTSNSTASVPFLGDLPLIGGLFRHTQETTVKSELVILLKATVIESPKQWAQGLRQVRESLNQIRYSPPVQ